MAKERQRRYASAGQLAEDLRRFLAGEPVRARPAGRWERARMWVRRRPATAALLVVSTVAVLAAGTGAAGLFYGARLERALTAEAQARQQAERSRYLYHISLAHAAWREGYTQRANQLLQDCPADQRGWEWHYLNRQCHAELLTLTGHTDAVWTVAFSPDGARIASAGEDRVVRIWDAAGGRELLRLVGHTRRVWTVAFSPDGKRLASAAEDGTVRIWDTKTGAETLRLHDQRNSSCGGVAFSPDGSRLACGLARNLAKVWDAATGRELVSLKGHSVTGGVTTMAFSPDGTRLAAANGDGPVDVWETATGRELFTARGGRRWGFGVAFRPDGRWLAASADETVKLWDLVSGREVRTLKGHAGDVNGLAFSPDGALLASSSDDGTVKVWSATKDEAPLTFRGHAGAVWGVAFSPDGSRLASAGRDGTVRIWGLFAAPGPSSFAAHAKELWCVACSPDGVLLAGAGEDPVVRIWDTRTGQVVRRFTGHTGRVAGLAFSPDGTHLASAGSDREFKLWDVARGREVHRLRAGGAQASAVAFSPDGAWLAGADRDGTVLVLDRRTFQVVLKLRGEFSPDPVFKIAFSPDGKRLASSAGARVWDLKDGREAFALRGNQSPVRSIAFSPDGARLAAAGNDQTIWLWDSRTGQKLLTLPGHSGNVLDLVFSPDGARLASGGDDGTVRLWDSATGQETLTLVGHRGGTRVCFSPDGTRLFSVGLDGAVKDWDARPLTPEGGAEREAVALLHFLLARPLSKPDIHDHLHRAPGLRPAVRQKARELLEFSCEVADPERYHRAAWAVVCQPHLNRFQYGFALRQAETACRLAPARKQFRLTLGGARYRAGHYREALATLKEFDAIDPGVPASLAFLAMTQHRLRQTEQARRTLARLRGGVKNSLCPKREAAQTLLREAEARIKNHPAGLAQ